MLQARARAVLMGQGLLNNIYNFMSEFYNRYRGLFDSVPSHSSKQTFQRQKRLFYEHNQHYSIKPANTPLLDNRKHSNTLGKSPALDEFDQLVRPRLNQNYPRADLFRLKTDHYDNLNRPQEAIPKMNTPDLGFYQLPKIYGPVRQQARKDRVLTEGSVPHKTKTNFRDNRNNISKNIEELEKQYFRYYPREEDRIVDQSGKRYAHLYNSRSRIVVDKAKAQKKMQESANRHLQWHKKKDEIENKTSKKQPEVNTSPKSPSNEAQYKAYQNRQNQLFGIKQNPYAFVNSKVQEIKKSEKYIPRGFINSYRQALLRRRKCKNEIEERRQKLRALLYSEQQSY